MRRPAGLGQPRRPPRRCEPYRSHNARNGIVVSTDRSVSSRPMSAIALLNLASATFQAHRRPRPASAHPRFGLSVEQDVAICARLTAAASAAPPGQSASEAAAGQLSRLLAGLPEPRISRLLRLKPLDLHPQSHHQQPASGPLTRDIVAYDTLVSVVSPFHRPRPVGEERRTMILPVHRIVNSSSSILRSSPDLLLGVASLEPLSIIVTPTRTRRPPLSARAGRRASPTSRDGSAMPFVTLLADCLASATSPHGLAIRMPPPLHDGRPWSSGRAAVQSSRFPVHRHGDTSCHVPAVSALPATSGPASAPVCRSCSTSRSPTSAIARTPLVHCRAARGPARAKHAPLRGAGSGVPGARTRAGEACSLPPDRKRRPA